MEDKKQITGPARGEIDWDVITEDPSERAMFDRNLGLLYGGDPRVAIATALRIWAQTHGNGSFGAQCAVYANEVAKMHIAVPALEAPAAKSDDLVAVPRDLIGSACAAIDKQRAAPKTLAELRRYTTGDLSRALEAPAATAEWQIVENTGTGGHAAGFYVFREAYGGNQWMQDKKRRIACFATHAQAVAAIAAAAPQAPAAPTPGMTPRNRETQDQIASVMLQHGTPQQQSQALAYVSGAAPAAPCGLCGANQAFTGTCGGGRQNPRALCFEEAAPAAPAVDALAPVQALLDVHAEMLDANPYAYFELAYTRQTGWMAWITDKPMHGPVINPDRQVLARGQGDTPAEACAAAAQAKEGGEAA